MKVIIITSHGANEWDGGGDSLITEGVKVLLPELLQHDLVYHVDIPTDQTDAFVRDCDYVVQAGTPSWVNESSRKYWSPCCKYNKHMAFVGIGLAFHYSFPMWYANNGPLGQQGEVTSLKDHGIIDVVVCRDKFCYFRLKEFGLPMHILPCPAFYSLPPKLVQEKNEVVISLPHPEETSHATPDTFKNFFHNCVQLVAQLKQRGANIHFIYQRTPEYVRVRRERGELKMDYDEYMTYLSNTFDGAEINSFQSFQEFSNFIASKEVYIGVRNHGALPCAGSGMPSMLLGTDYRQTLSDEIPFISRTDISHVDWNPRLIVQWYDSLVPKGLSKSLVEFRRQTFQTWQSILEPVKRRLHR